MWERYKGALGVCQSLGLMDNLTAKGLWSKGVYEHPGLYKCKKKDVGFWRFEKRRGVGVVSEMDFKRSHFHEDWVGWLEIRNVERDGKRNNTWRIKGRNVEEMETKSLKDKIEEM